MSSFDPVVSPSSRAPCSVSRRIYHSLLAAQYGDDQDLQVSKCSVLTSAVILGGYRWQGTSPGALGQHCRQAAAQWSEDCSSAMRGAEHFWRILPRKA